MKVLVVAVLVAVLVVALLIGIGAICASIAGTRRYRSRECDIA